MGAKNHSHGESSANLVGHIIIHTFFNIVFLYSASSANAWEKNKSKDLGFHSQVDYCGVVTFMRANSFYSNPIHPHYAAIFYVHMSNIRVRLWKILLKFRKISPDRKNLLSGFMYPISNSDRYWHANVRYILAAAVKRGIGRSC